MYVAWYSLSFAAKALLWCHTKLVELAFDDGLYDFVNIRLYDFLVRSWSFLITGCVWIKYTCIMSSQATWLCIIFTCTPCIHLHSLHSWLHYVMHIDSAKEGSAQELLWIDKPNNELHQEQEEYVSLIISVPVSRGCLGWSLTTRQTNLD